MTDLINEILKKFKAWFGVKIKLSEKTDKKLFKQGEIWWCSLGFNVGEEIFGKGKFFTRPILIFKKFTGNSFLGLPLTTQNKQGTWYVEIQVRGKKNLVMLNQARILDKKRLRNRITMLENNVFKKVQEKFLDFYDFKN